MILALIEDMYEYSNDRNKFTHVFKNTFLRTVNSYIEFYVFYPEVSVKQYRD